MKSPNKASLSSHSFSLNHNFCHIYYTNSNICKETPLDPYFRSQKNRLVMQDGTLGEAMRQQRLN